MNNGPKIVNEGIEAKVLASKVINQRISEYDPRIETIPELFSSLKSMPEKIGDFLEEINVEINKEIKY